MKNVILGISAYYHDSAAALVIDGDIVAAAQEERFSRKKNDSNFPSKAIVSILKYAHIKPEEVNLISFYEKNFLKFERLLETYHSFAPIGLESFLKSMPVWIKEKLFMKKLIRDELSTIGFDKNIKIIFPEHHLSHSASAFYPSPFQESAIITLDGVGEWDTASISSGNGHKIKLLRTMEFPHSVGLLYSAFTYYCGFKVNEGEYKLMGLAPYSNPNSKSVNEIINKIETELVKIHNDGSIVINLDYFNFPVGLTMTKDSSWEKLFALKRRKSDSALTQEYADLAFAVQKVTEKIFLAMAQTAKDLTGSTNLVLAGGVALNSVANGILLKSNIFENIWIQPASGDAGGSLGAALTAYHIYLDKHRIVEQPDKMKGSLLGIEYENSDVENVLQRWEYQYHHITSKDELYKLAARYIEDGKVVGYFQGRMEFGPRALGCRSFLADSRIAEMQSKLNLKIKFREGFRPFAPAVMEEHAQSWFDIEVPSPYMLNVIPVKDDLCNPLPEDYYNMGLMERLYFKRSKIPAVTHLDYSARIQTVNKDVNPHFYGVIKSFYEITGCPVIINTSFNVRDEPIVSSPEDALNCFMKTDTDILFLNDYLIIKSEQSIISDEQLSDFGGEK